MKKSVSFLCGMFLLANVANAQVQVSDYIKKIPELNQAVIYNINDSEVNYATTVTLCAFLDDTVKVDIGYTPKQELIGLVSFKLVEVGDWIKYPILDKVEIEPFVYIGADRIDSTLDTETNWGVGVKILSIKF